MTRTRLSYLSILFLAVLFLQAAPVNAHGPSAVHLDYDFGTQVLTVDVSHSTGTPGTHYIVEIVIEKNSVEFTSRDYTSQPSTSNIVDTFDVSTVHSDILTVTAFCNIAGQLTESITVIDPSVTTTTTDTTTTTTDTTTTTPTTTTTSSGSTTSPTPPADMDLTLVIIAGAAGVVIIIIAVVFVKRG